MSRRGNCRDNASQESFFGHLKDEIPYQSCTSLEELRRMVNEYIQYYNEEQGQWKTGLIFQIYRRYSQFLDLWYDFSGKTILPLCTHEGSGMGSSEGDIKKLCPGAKLQKGLAIRGGSVNNAKNEIEAWLKTNGIL